jgi:GDPmannose 4,6-dehydratase
MATKALITGMTGQDGSYLAEYLLELGYEVHGLVRRLSVAENQSSRINAIINDVHCHYGDMTDEHSLNRIVKTVQPDEVYNLAAMSHVRISYDNPAFTIRTNGLGVLNILEAVRQETPHARFYQASSSEMFGNSVDFDGFQRLTTPMNPVSPYGCAKVLAYNLTRHYRHAYKMAICNGILFNHESPRRGSNFVTNKIAKSAVEISRGFRKRLVLGNLDASRDWGHSYDYVRAIHKITTYAVPSDWIVATGETNSVRDFCQIAFQHLGLTYTDYVDQDQKFMRPEELNYLRGDASLTRTVLDWKPTISFENLVIEMVDHWCNELPLP